MRIAYGVMGYGRGHAMRTMSVLPALMAEHEVTVYAGGDAFDVLAPLFPTVRIPTIGYRYNNRGGHSVPRTVRENLAPMADLLLRGPGTDALERELTSRGTELIISDSEAWTHRAAQRLGIPRISFDHVGIIAWCRPHFPTDLWLAGQRDAWGYRTLMGEPDRVLISSFYPAEPYRDDARIVGPMLRDVVKAQKPARGDFLLVYFNKGMHQYRAHVDRTLRLLEMPVKVYGTPWEGSSENIEFCAPSNEWFVRDLAQCRAVLSTAGNQLIGEALHLGKPLLAVPEDAFEQRLNAAMVERMGVGMRVGASALTPSHVDRFLSQEDAFAARTAEYAGDGRTEAVATLDRYIQELGGARQPRRRPAGAAARRAPRDRAAGDHATAH